LRDIGWKLFGKIREAMPVGEREGTGSLSSGSNRYLGGTPTRPCGTLEENGVERLAAGNALCRLVTSVSRNLHHMIGNLGKI
jgi:hypothetical protein